MQQLLNRRMPNFYKTSIFILLLAGIISSQLVFDIEKSKTKFHEPTVLSAEVLKVADLGLNNAAGDLMWLAAIQYFGGSQSPTDEKLVDYLIAAASLNPRFSYPYAFGALILPSINKTDEGIDLALKGLQDAEPNWEIPYYLATTYHLSKNDTVNATKYFDLAARTPGAPAGAQRVAATYGSRPDLRAQTEEIWQGIYETTNDEVVKERAKNYIIHYEILNLLERAALEYKNENGTFPASVDDLVNAKILKIVPVDPFGFRYTIDITGRADIKTN